MSEHRKENERLIAETFQGNWSDGPAAHFARIAAAHARRRRRQRATLVGVSAAAVAAGISLVTLQRSRSAIRSPEATPAAARSYEIISDAELLAELRDRSVVMVRQPSGAREFVLVGQ
jgi:hypothetical protein